MFIRLRDVGTTFHTIYPQFFGHKKLDISMIYRAFGFLLFLSSVQNTVNQELNHFLDVLGLMLILFR